ECRVRIVDGEHNVFPPSAKELSLIGTGHFIDQRRLSCQLKCFGDVTVDLSEQATKEISDLQRRPQGSLRKDDSEVSRAVTGNLIEEDVQLLDVVSVKVQNNISLEKSKNNVVKESSTKDQSTKKNRHQRRRNRSHKFRPKN
ncbi:MAG: hypothetical protein KDD40_10130, partial [Bdellovibrionales bacterium]|nr:hypothetical protein [Bdellovibrionales bacterium]